MTSVSYRYSHTIYRLFKGFITRFEDKGRHYDDTFILPEMAEVLVIGMGRVGSGAYKALSKSIGTKVWGIDSDEDRALYLQAQGERVLFGDGHDVDLWLSIDLSQIKLVYMALPCVDDILMVQEQLCASHYLGKVVAIVRHEDQISELSQSGIDRIFNIYTEAGVGFANESLALLTE